MASETPRRLIRAEEAGRMLGLDQVTKSGNAAAVKRVIFEMVRRGELRAVQVSKWKLIDARSVERLIEGR